MTTPGYYNSGKRLEEGKRYQFHVIGQVMLQDEKIYYILEDPFKIRHLLYSGLYKNYRIETGQMIICKVDKINCTGRVYLEPDHPFYSEGHTYDFNFSTISKNAQSDKKSLIVFDMFDNEISLDCPKHFMCEAGKIACKIIRLRKGKPMLVLAPDFKWNPDL